MSRTILQIPIDPKLRKSAEKAACEQGFSSLQEAVRVFLKQFVEKKVAINFEPEPTQLSPRAIKRYNKIIDEIESGKVRLEDLPTFDNAAEMTAYLRRGCKATPKVSKSFPAANCP